MFTSFLENSETIDIDISIQTSNTDVGVSIAPPSTFLEGHEPSIFFFH